MAFVKRSAVTALANAAASDTATLPNRAVVQRTRRAVANGSPNDTGIEAAAVLQALRSKRGKKKKTPRGEE